ncbi:MAG: hypothetical protein Q8Q23_00020 [bacterium]|nr:hypothetical protein [bacterium]
MSKKAIEYLKLNKKKYSEAVLVEALKKAGYSSHDILESINEVFGKSSKSGGMQTDFWNFRDKKRYMNDTERNIDFFVGLGVPILIYLFAPGLFFLILLLQIVGAAILMKRRRRIAIGLLISIVGAPLILLLVMLIQF